MDVQRGRVLVIGEADDGGQLLKVPADDQVAAIAKDFRIAERLGDGARVGSEVFVTVERAAAADHGDDGAHDAEDDDDEQRERNGWQMHIRERVDATLLPKTNFGNQLPKTNFGKQLQN